MKVSGFTIVRNALKFDYPIVEAIKSISPICDEIIVAVGKSEDDTLQLIKSIGDPKIKIIETVWDDSLREGGKVLAVETNKAKEAVSKDSDWLFYIQGDEVFHEDGIDNLKNQLIKFKDDKAVDGLLFDYTHFYGSYDFVGDSRRWYRHEIRVIKNDPHINSYRDAQGFRINGEKLKVKKAHANIFHYGWVKPPELQQAKQESFHKMWHDDEWMKKNVGKKDEFDYSKIDSLALFESKHPNVMSDRIKLMNWKFDFDPSYKKLSIKARFLRFFENLTGHRIGEYKNYQLIK